jgi:histidinol-phosphate aminotransferase
MSIAILPPTTSARSSPYQPGKPISELAREMGLAEESIVKLASNENPLGMSARAAMPRSRRWRHLRAIRTAARSR